MADMYVPVRAFFQELGFETVVPPAISKKTLDLGVKYSPEFACLPFKINLGNFIEALERGAEIIVMGGGCGPCRFGYYAEVQEAILRELGYSFEMFVIEPGLFSNYKRIRNVFGNIPFHRLLPAARMAWKKAAAIDEIYRLVLKMRACEKKPGQVNKIYDAFIGEIDNTVSVDKIRLIKKEYEEKIKDSKAEYKRGIEIRIAIVGEIYLVLEPFVNLEIERRLGELGVVVERELYITNWLLDFLNLSGERKLMERAAGKYLANFVGGHGQDSIGHAVIYAEKAFDGVIQLAPFTCMPEIISRSILPVVSREEGIPVLSLFFDEHSADTGIQTRLEAFVDLLERRKILQEGSFCESR
ncbi:MAG: CoA protein activase [Halanaerobiaceae bacterium]|jgi:predicted nucleotide-binding protein (sugar kinase/HSP70/actin superfamily)|nr:CoA protein activase [Halanaerobiaceae bacterium]